jgi:hypothetical protein
MAPPLIDAWRTAAPKRRFAGRSPAAGSRPEDLAALAEAFLSTPPAPPAEPDAVLTGASLAACPPVPSEQHTGGQAASGTPANETLAPAPPDGSSALAQLTMDLYVLIPSGVDAPDRRHAALAAATRLAPHGQSTAIFLFEQGRAEAHLVGETPCGRLGPQGCLATGDTGHTVADLVGLCDQVAIISLDGPRDALRRLVPLAARTVFMATTDAESLVETYRGLKSWQAGAGASAASLFFVGADGPEEAGQLHRRLSNTARQCLGLELENSGFLPLGHSEARGLEPAEPLLILAQTPAADVWPHLLSAARRRALPESSAPLPPPDLAPSSIVQAILTPAAPPVVSSPPSDVCPVFSLWKPEGAEAVLAALESQGPAFLSDSLRHIFRVEVDEPDAPPLAAVRADGALVAILLARPGETVSTQAACRWLAVHRKLVGRAYPCAGIRDGAEPSAIVLAPLETPAMADGIRRFLPIRMGGHRGLVLLT